MMEEDRRENNWGRVVDIYPLNGYYFGSKDSLLTNYTHQSSPDHRLLRLNNNYEARGLRTCVQAVILVHPSFSLTANPIIIFAFSFSLTANPIIIIVVVVIVIVIIFALGTCGILVVIFLVELFKHPHLLLLQIRNSTFQLPGGRLRPGESDVEGLRRKLSRKLSLDEARDETEWEVAECLGIWWRLDFETPFVPCLPPNSKKPKECTKIFLVKLPVSRKFIVPKNMKLLAVPLCQLHENHKIYGSIIAGIPQLLSKFSFNMIET